MAEGQADLQRIKELLEIMKNNDLVEVEISHGEDKIHLKRGETQPPGVTIIPSSAALSAATGPAMPVAQQSPADEAEPASDLVEIKAPMVGTFYATSSPDTEHYVEVGSEVSGQTVVCIIEAMKVMNEIKAETEGVIAEICVKTGEAVEYGQVLFRVKPI